MFYLSPKVAIVSASPLATKPLFFIFLWLSLRLHLLSMSVIIHFPSFLNTLTTAVWLFWHCLYPLLSESDFMSCSLSEPSLPLVQYFLYSRYLLSISPEMIVCKLKKKIKKLQIYTRSVALLLKNMVLGKCVWGSLKYPYRPVCLNTWSPVGSICRLWNL